MFSKNDYFLKIAKILVDVLFVIELIASLLFAIIYAVTLKNALFLLILPGGTISSWVIWIFARLWISFFCDVKLIRNKVYGKSNNNLQEFLGEDYSMKRRSSSLDYSSVSNEKEMQIKRLNRLLESGAISESDYNREIRKLLDE